MTHTERFEQFRARREQERQADVKVTWRKVSADTGGGVSGLGPHGRLVFVRPATHDARQFNYGTRIGRLTTVLGTAATYGGAKRAAEALFAREELWA